MRKIILTMLAIASFSITLSAQKTKAELSENSIVKDTLGTQYPYALWSPLYISGRYDFKPEQPDNKSSAFIISRLSDEQFEKKMSAMPKPAESQYFKTGARFSHFKTTDIDGNKINTKDLVGKIVVLNFWFINCPPCRLEMPELHQLSEQYKNDSNVVFVAIGLDKKDDIREFLKLHPFGYRLIDDGAQIVNQFSLNSFPTNVVINPDGKVFFHSSGLALNTVYWLRKTIEELK